MLDFNFLSVLLILSTPILTHHEVLGESFEWIPGPNDTLHNDLLDNSAY